MTTTEQLRAPLQKWVTANCHISTCAYEETKYNTILVNDCNCGLEDARAALALPVEPSPDARYYWENGSLKWTHPIDVGHLIVQLQTLDPAMKVSSVMSIPMDPERKARAHGLSMSYERWDEMGWLDYKNEALPMCLAIWAYDNHLPGSAPMPSSDLLAAADALAEVVYEQIDCGFFSDSEDELHPLECEECSGRGTTATLVHASHCIIGKLVVARSAYRAARNQAPSQPTFHERLQNAADEARSPIRPPSIKDLIKGAREQANRSHPRQIAERRTERNHDQT